jgi:O-antigen ligase
MAKFSSKSALKLEAPSLTVAIILIGALLVGYLLTMISAVHSFVLILLLLVSVCTFVWPEAGLYVVILLVSVCTFVWPEAGLYVVIFSMLLSPEIIAGEIGGKAALGRGFTLRLEDFLLLFIGLSWFARTAVDKTTGLFRKTPGKAGFFFVLKYFEYMIVFFMVVNYVNTEDQAKRLLVCLFITCFIVSVYGLIQVPGGGRVSTPFEGQSGEPNTFGGYLVFMGAIALALIDNLKDLRVRLGLSLLLTVLLISLLYTQSRASYIAIVPAYLTLSLFSQRRFYLLAGLVLVLALSPLIVPRVAKERIAETFTQPVQTGQIQFGKLRIDTSASARIISYKEALSDWQKRPILGHGVTGYTFMDAQYPRILVETGIVGLLAFAWIVYTLFRVGVSTWQDAQDDLLRGLALGLIAGLVGLLVHAIGANTFIIVRIMEPFWFLTGIVIALSQMNDESIHAPSI